MTPLLEARDLTAGYPGHRPTVRMASIGLRAGGRVALLGANGSGKTTILRCLAGRHEPAAGSIHLDGVVLSYGRRALRSHRRSVQLVLQDPDDQLFSADVVQDVSFGPMNLGLPEDDVRARVAEALRLLGVEHLAERPTHQLSYGERKRVATAGAVAMRPRVLLLDEPTAGLDPAGVGEVRAAMDRLIANGTSVLVATHDVDLALEWADEVALVVDSHVVQGDPADLLGDQDLVHRSRLSRPWTLEVAAQLGLRDRPRSLSDLVASIGSCPPRDDT